MTRLVYIVFFFLCPLDAAKAFCVCVEWAKIPRKRRICSYVLSNWLRACRLNKPTFLRQRERTLSLLRQAWGQKWASLRDTSLARHNEIDPATVQSCHRLVRVVKGGCLWRFNSRFRFYECRVVGLSIRFPMTNPLHAKLAVFYDAWGKTDLRDPASSSLFWLPELQNASPATLAFDENIISNIRRKKLTLKAHQNFVEENIGRVGCHRAGMLEYDIPAHIGAETDMFVFTFACQDCFSRQDYHFWPFQLDPKSVHAETHHEVNNSSISRKQSPRYLIIVTTKKQENKADISKRNGVSKCVSSSGVKTKLLSSILANPAWQMSTPGARDDEFITPDPDRWSHVPASVPWSKDANLDARELSAAGRGHHKN